MHYYVYLIRSSKYPDQIYIGYTKDPKKRLASHNAGSSFHTAKYKPWELVVFLGFSSEANALEFERYLKSGTGRAFVAKRFLAPIS